MDNPRKDIRPPRPRLPMKWVAIWIFIILLILVAVQYQSKRQAGYYETNMAAIEQDIERNWVDIDASVLNGNRLEGRYRKKTEMPGVPDEKAGKKFAIYVNPNDKSSQEYLSQKGISYKPRNDFWTGSPWSKPR